MRNDFFAGAITFGFLLISLYFLKFWRKSREPLFAVFSLAFLLMGVERMIETILRSSEFQTPVVYLIRFCAFTLIIVAIIQKNVSSKR